MRQRLSMPQAGVIDRQIYRAHARRYHAWFAAHNLIWVVLAGVSTLLLLFLFGVRAFVFAYATAALACTLYSVYGLTWLRSPHEIGLCWESEALNREAGYWARGNTVLLLWDRFAAALQEDLQRARPKSRILLVAFAGVEVEHNRIEGLQEHQPLPALVLREFYERGRAFAAPFILVLLLASLVFTLTGSWLFQARQVAAATYAPQPTGLPEDQVQSEIGATNADSVSASAAGSQNGEVSNNVAVEGKGNQSQDGEAGAQDAGETGAGGPGDDRDTASGSSGDAGGAQSSSTDGGDNGETSGETAQGGQAQDASEAASVAAEGQGDPPQSEEDNGEGSGESSAGTDGADEANGEGQDQLAQNGDADGQTEQSADDTGTDGAASGGEQSGDSADEVNGDQDQPAQSESVSEEGSGGASAADGGENSENREGQAEESTEGADEGASSGEQVGDENAAGAGEEQGAAETSEENGTAGGAGEGDATAGSDSTPQDTGETAEENGTEGGSGEFSGPDSDSSMNEPGTEDNAGGIAADEELAQENNATTASGPGPRYDIELPSMTAVGAEDDPAGRPERERVPAPPQGSLFASQPEANGAPRGPLQPIPNWILSLLRGLGR